MTLREERYNQRRRNRIVILMRFLLPAAIFLASLRAFADDVESLHVVNFNFDLKPGWTLQLHTRARTFENIGSYNQTRVGPILMWQAAPRFTALAGYYYINQSTRVTHDPYSLHRVWGGGQYRILRSETWSVDARSLMERFLSSEINGYWRWRSRAMFNRSTRIGMPYASGEALMQQGVWYGRYTGGMQWQLNRRLIVGTGYEYRDAPRGAGAHIIATFFQWTAHRHTPPHID